MRSREAEAVPMGGALSYRMKDAARVSGIGLTKLYELRKEGKLPAVKVAGRVLIPADALRRLIAEAPAAGDDNDARQVQARHAGAVRHGRAARGAGGEAGR
jgi:excisionase family DNA binding protein